MYNFKSENKFNITGRGTVFITKNPHDCNDFDHLSNKVVVIDNCYYRVIGVEIFPIIRQYKKDSTIGLLVGNIIPYGEISKLHDQIEDLKKLYTTQIICHQEMREKLSSCQLYLDIINDIMTEANKFPEA